MKGSHGHIQRKGGHVSCVVQLSGVWDVGGSRPGRKDGFGIIGGGGCQLGERGCQGPSHTVLIIIHTTSQVSTMIHRFHRRSHKPQTLR